MCKIRAENIYEDVIAIKINSYLSWVKCMPPLQNIIMNLKKALIKILLVMN